MARSLRAKVTKRLFDIVVGAVLVALSAPVIAIAAIGIKMVSAGPVLYRARRSGKDGRVFEMLKLRTMRIGTASASAITAPGDSRIFPFGRLIRDLKIDELPQFWNVLIGDMSVVGPRAEDPAIVANHYSDWMLETLRVAPGLTSPGAIYGYMVSDDLLDPDNPEISYIERLLGPKLALERSYVDRASFYGDIRYILLTVWAIVSHVRGHKVRLPKLDVEAAQRWAPGGPYESVR